MIPSKPLIGIAAAMALLLAGCAAAPPENREKAISSTLWEMAVSSEKSHDYATAVGQYHQVYERDPTNMAALLAMARTMRYAGAAKDAIKELKIAIEKGGEKPDLVLELGKAQLAASLINDAKETLEKYMGMARRDWQAHSALALAYDRLSRHDEAQEHYREALKLAPGNVSVTNNLALSYAVSGQLDQAIALLGKATESERATPQMRQNLALLYAMRGEIKSAERLAAEDLSPEQVIQNMEAYRLLRGDPAPARTSVPAARR
jgi:Flp pilus assembly protein TadD